MVDISISDDLYKEFKIILEKSEEELNEKKVIEDMFKQYIKDKKLLEFVKEHK